MKIAVTIFLFLMATNAWSQSTISDTVKINAVTVNAVSPKMNQENLDSSVLSNPQHLNLGDLLSKKSHLFIKSYGIGSMATVSLRGSGSAHTQLNWNGIALNSSMNGSSDLALFPLFFMDDVSVNYGLNSIEDGAGGIGGAVNISTEPSFHKRVSASISSTIGSFGQQEWNGKVIAGNEKIQSITRILHSKADNNFAYKDVTVEGFPSRNVQNASLEQKGIMQNLFFKLKNNQLLEANVWLFDSERNLPPLITLRENTEFQEDRTCRGLVKYSKYFKNSTFKVTTAYLEDQLFYENERAGISSNSTTRSIRSRMDYEFSFKKIELHSQIKYATNRAQADGLTEEVVQDQAAFFIQADRDITKQLSANLSLRTLHILKNESYLLPQLRLDYQLQKLNTQLFASAGKNVRYPSLNDLYFRPSGNQNLLAEESASVEFGGIYQKDLWKKAIQFTTSTTLFYNNIENYIQWEPTAFGYWRPTNLKSVETMGAELFVQLKQVEGKLKKQFNATYSYTSSKNYEKNHEFDESRGKQLIYIPEHKANASLELGIHNIDFSVNYQVIGMRYISSDNEEFLPNYSLLDASIRKSIRWRAKSIVELSVGVKNLLDTEYQAIEWRPMPNRNYFIKISYQFQK